MTSTSVPHPFEEVLNLEEQFYAEGYEQGTADGIQAGKVEGRSVGFAKGFEKFMESGRIYGRSLVWANRLPSRASSPDDAGTSLTSPASTTTAPGAVDVARDTTPVEGSVGQTPKEKTKCSLPPLLAGSARLEKHVVTVHALVEPETLSRENSDEAVNDFDDRIKRAQGRVKVLERMIGETSLEKEATRASGPSTAM